jgi:hypothetical protein
MTELTVEMRDPEDAERQEEPEEEGQQEEEEEEEETTTAAVPQQQPLAAPSTTAKYKPREGCPYCARGSPSWDCGHEGCQSHYHTSRMLARHEANDSHACPPSCLLCATIKQGQPAFSLSPSPSPFPLSLSLCATSCVL